jgi:hypothetical protein
LVSRLHDIANYTDVDRYTYAIDMLPDKVVWGKKAPFGPDTSALLCVAGKTKPYVPYVVWLLGRASRMWFYNRDKEPQPQVSINIVPWTNGTASRVRHLLAQMSEPKGRKSFVSFNYSIHYLIHY